MLTPEQMQALTAMIDGRRATLESEIHEDAARSRAAPYAELAGAAADTGDSATADVLVDVDNAALSRDLQELRALDAARDRIDAGSYGACVDCGQDLEYERLRAEPAALRCITCQRMHDKTHRSAPAPSL